MEIAEDGDGGGPASGALGAKANHFAVGELDLETVLGAAGLAQEAVGVGEFGGDLGGDALDSSGGAGDELVAGGIGRDGIDAVRGDRSGAIQVSKALSIIRESLSAESRPLRSRMGSASAKPWDWARAMASSFVRPADQASKTTPQVPLTMPRIS